VKVIRQQRSQHPSRLDACPSLYLEAWANPYSYV